CGAPFCRLLSVRLADRKCARESAAPRRFTLLNVEHGGADDRAGEPLLDPSNALSLGFEDASYLLVREACCCRDRAEAAAGVVCFQDSGRKPLLGRLACPCCLLELLVASRLSLLCSTHNVSILDGWADDA